MQVKKQWEWEILNLWLLFGLFFGLKKILDITLLAFLLSSIIAIGIIIYRKKKKIDDEYIPFGPFLVIGIALMLFLPSGTIVDGFMVFCNMISQNILLLIGK
ncbi:MAG: hypothetical protein HG454_001730 [Clostridiales bacterium]|nr:hypothetical protein [Clostridiales bacterium]